MCKTLVSKYNVPGPRYTSYPTVPYWNIQDFTALKWIHSLKERFNNEVNQNQISLYIHLPFCESLCTFCGCNMRITKNHDVEIPYINAVLKEFKLYIEILEKQPEIKQIHLGGGTPTFFSPKNLDYLLSEIFKIAKKSKNIEFSFEGHPNNTTVAHLKLLKNYGFNRVCYGVQDYNLKVQKAINRFQPFKNVESVTKNARNLGYTSIAHDIVYGLPFQKLKDLEFTIQKTITLKPNRIALYSYAHVPWIKGNGQRGFKESNLPNAKEKLNQYKLGKQLLKKAGYIEIGMDHFALKNDSLSKALFNDNLHRNFMGYTTQKSNIMIGLGVSAISDCWSAFAQNVKSVEEYISLIEKNRIPLLKGHILNKEDLIIRKHILNLMCQFKTDWKDPSMYFEEIPLIMEKLKEMEYDGLILIFENKLEVLPKGKPFIRNICLPFDMRMQRKKPKTQLFSMTV